MFESRWEQEENAQTAEKQGFASAIYYEEFKKRRLARKTAAVLTGKKLKNSCKQPPTSKIPPGKQAARIIADMLSFIKHQSKPK